MSTVQPDAATSTTPRTRRKIQRSPNYPSINLEAAIGKARLVLDSEGKHEAAVSVILSLWGYTNHSSSNAQSSLSALIKFGLLQSNGEGAERKVSLTERALRILQDERSVSPERDKAIEAAALSPTIHKELWNKWGSDLPSDSNIRTHLIMDREFNSSKVDDFIREYKSTLAFAKLDKREVLPENDGSGEPPAEESEIAVGSYVQWTSQGIDQFPEPVKVAQIVDGPDGKRYAYVEADYEGALAVEQLAVATPVLSETPAPLGPNPFFKPRNSLLLTDQPKEGMELERKTLDEGAVVLQWPATLSTDSVDELEHWFQGVLRRARRKAGLPPRKKPTPK